MNDLTTMSNILIPYYKGEIVIDADDEYVSLSVMEEDGGQPSSNYPDNIKYTRVAIMFEQGTGDFAGLLTASDMDKKGSK